MPSTSLRQSVLTAARHVVVKMGTQLLSKDQGGIDQAYLNDVARQVAELRRRRRLIREPQRDGGALVAVRDRQPWQVRRQGR